MDGSGNVLVADSNYALKEILAARGYTTANTLGSGFSIPTGIAVDVVCGLSLLVEPTAVDAKFGLGASASGANTELCPDPCANIRHRTIHGKHHLRFQWRRGLRGGQWSATISRSTVTLTGTHSVVLSASQVASGNYTEATATASFTVATGFTLTSSSGTATVAPGGVATFLLQEGV